MQSDQQPTTSDLLALAQEIADTEHISHDQAYQRAKQEYSSLQQEDFSEAKICIIATLYVVPSSLGLVLCRDRRRVVIGRNEIPTLIRVLEETYRG